MSSSLNLQGYNQAPYPNQMMKYSLQFSQSGILGTTSQNILNNFQPLQSKKSRLPKMRQQDPFYKRVQDIEKKAKALEQDREEHQDQYDINDFFEDNPATAIMGGQSQTIQSNQPPMFTLDSNMSLGDHKVV
jgi:hypothetical protein